MSDNEKKLYEIECTVWKDNGEYATLDEVLAAKAAVKAMLPELSGSDYRSAIDLLNSLTRYSMFLEDGIFLEPTDEKREVKCINRTGKRKPS